MNDKQRLFGKALNVMITGKNQEYSLDEYVFASLTSKPLKIIDKHNSDDELDYDVECSNCGAIVNYGEHIFMRSGRIYCDTKGCLDLFEAKYGK